MILLTVITLLTIAVRSKHNSFERIPTTCDVLVAWATQEGNLSFRFWFTNAIANVFSQHAYIEHVCDMLTMVKDGVAKRSAQTRDSMIPNCKAMPQVEENLRKKYTFFLAFLETVSESKTIIK